MRINYLLAIVLLFIQISHLAAQTTHAQYVHLTNNQTVKGIVTKDKYGVIITTVDSDSYRYDYSDVAIISNKPNSLDSNRLGLTFGINIGLGFEGMTSDIHNQTLLRLPSFLGISEKAVIDEETSFICELDIEQLGYKNAETKEAKSYTSFSMPMFFEKNETRGNTSILVDVGMNPRFIIGNSDGYRKFDFGILLGGGIEQRIMPKVCLSVRLRYSNGILGSSKGTGGANFFSYNFLIGSSIDL